MATSGWELKSIEELKAPIKGSIAIGPFGSRMKSDCYVPSGVPVIRGNNIGDTRVLVGDMVFITPKLADQLGNAIVHADDLVFPHRGAIGAIGIVPRDNIDRYALSSSLMKLTCDRNQVDPLYLFYYFRSDDGQHELLKNASTVGTPGIGQPLSSLRSIKVPIPPLAEQKVIVEALGALDDKIELNRRMNATLEAMARALFQSWFVDFDPVRAKLDGGQPAGMDAATAELFPDTFQDSVVGPVPRGWEPAELGQIADVVDCLHAKKPEKSDEGELYLQLNNIRDDGLIDISDAFLVSQSDYQKWISRMEAKEGDCVITNVGRVGAVAQIPEGVKAALGRNMTGIRCVADFQYPTFLIECLLSGSMREEIRMKMDTGTILDALNVRSIPNLRFVRPTREIASHFEKIVRPLRRRMERNIQESRTLITLRDTLLPKLLSGELSTTN